MRFKITVQLDLFQYYNATWLTLVFLKKTSDCVLHLIIEMSENVDHKSIKQDEKIDTIIIFYCQILSKLTMVEIKQWCSFCLFKEPQRVHSSPPNKLLAHPSLLCLAWLPTICRSFPSCSSLCLSLGFKQMLAPSFLTSG